MLTGCLVIRISYSLSLNIRRQNIKDSTIIRASEGSEIPAFKISLLISTDKGVRKTINIKSLSDAKKANKAMSNTPITAGNQKNSCHNSKEFIKIKTPATK